MNIICFGLGKFYFTLPKDDNKPEMIDIRFGNETIYHGTSEQFYRMLKAFKMVSQEGK